MQSTLPSPSGEGGHVVCVLSIDTQYAIAGNYEHTYRELATPALARLIGTKLAQMMYREGWDTTTRGVFLKRPDGTWETLGTYWDIKQRRSTPDGQEV